MKKTSPEKYEELINQCIEHCQVQYCFLKHLIQHQHTNPRTLCQIKCIEIFKWEKSAEVGHDIGWTKAAELWVIEGPAEHFSNAYKEALEINDKEDKAEEDINIRKVYLRTLQLMKIHQALVDTQQIQAIPIIPKQ